MPNPKGKPENLKPFTTNRDESLTAKLTLRVTQSMIERIKAIDNYPDFCRQALQQALDELEANQNNAE